MAVFTSFLGNFCLAKLKKIKVNLFDAMLQPKIKAKKQRVRHINRKYKKKRYICRH